MATKTALLIGGTGLVGSRLLQHLLDDERFGTVVSFVRKPTGTEHPKLEEHVIDFDDLCAWRELVKGDVLFSALGTTLKEAGGKIEQFKVDFTYQYQFAYIASQNKVGTYVLVSAAGASPEAYIFYSKVKGMLEDEIKKLGFEKIVILQPGPLKGERKKNRFAEKITIYAMDRINKLGLLKKFRPISGDEMASAMISLGENSTEPLKTVALDAVFDYVE